MTAAPSVLRIGVVDPVGSIDPRTMAEATTILMARQIFETPFLASSAGDAIPALFQERPVEEPGSAGAFGENPLAFRATGLLLPALGKTNDRLTPDLERGRSEWQEAGGYPGPLTSIYSPAPRPYLPAPAAVARHLRDRFRRLGADVDTLEIPSSELMCGRACVAHAWRLHGFQPAVTGLVDLSALTLT